MPTPSHVDGRRINSICRLQCAMLAFVREFACSLMPIHRTEEQRNQDTSLSAMKRICSVGGGLVR